MTNLIFSYILINMLLIVCIPLIYRLEKTERYNGRHPTAAKLFYEIFI